MFKKWLSLFCIFLPAAIALLAAHAMADVPAAPSSRPVCANGGTLAGLDVSAYQNPQNWGSTLKSGRQFAFVKATQGVGITNETFQKDWQATKEAGILRGSYHYFVPSDDPVAQAEHFLTTIGTLDQDDLPPMFDFELVDSTLTSDQITARALEWLARVQEATGRTPIVYTNPGYWQQLGNPSGFDRYPLFIADYGVNCPTVPVVWKTWTFWQHVIGPVSGILNNTDQDFFNGSLDALKLL